MTYEIGKIAAVGFRMSTLAEVNDLIAELNLNEISAEEAEKIIPNQPKVIGSVALTAPKKTVLQVMNFSLPNSTKELVTYLENFSRLWARRYAINAAIGWPVPQVDVEKALVSATSAATRIASIQNELRLGCKKFRWVTKRGIELVLKEFAKGTFCFENFSSDNLTAPELSIVEQINDDAVAPMSVQAMYEIIQLGIKYDGQIVSEGGHLDAPKVVPHADVEKDLLSAPTLAVRALVESTTVPLVLRAGEPIHADDPESQNMDCLDHVLREQDYRYDRKGNCICLNVPCGDFSAQLHFSAGPAGVIFEAALPLLINENHRHAVSSGIHLMNRKLSRGSFGFQESTGIVVFRSTLPLATSPCTNQFSELLCSSLLALEYFAPGLMQLGLENEDPEAVMNRCVGQAGQGCTSR